MTENPATSKLTFPSDADYRNRIERAQAEMKKHGIDVLALAGIDIHRFFTGLNGLPVTRPIWLVLQQDGTAGFVSPGSEVKEIRARCRTPVAAKWVEWKEPMPAPMTHQDALAKHLEEIAPDARTIGVDFTGTTGGNIELVKQALGAERIKDVTPMLRELLAVKDAAALVSTGGELSARMGFQFSLGGDCGSGISRRRDRRWSFRVGGRGAWAAVGL